MKVREFHSALWAFLLMVGELGGKWLEGTAINEP